MASNRTQNPARAKMLVDLGRQAFVNKTNTGTEGHKPRQDAHGKVTHWLNSCKEVPENRPSFNFIRTMQSHSRQRFNYNKGETRAKRSLCFDQPTKQCLPAPKVPRLSHSNLENNISNSAMAIERKITASRPVQLNQKNAGLKAKRFLNFDKNPDKTLPGPGPKSSCLYEKTKCRRNERNDHIPCVHNEEAFSNIDNHNKKPVESVSIKVKESSSLLPAKRSRRASPINMQSCDFKTSGIVPKKSIANNRVAYSVFNKGGSVEESLNTSSLDKHTSLVRSDNIKEKECSPLLATENSVRSQVILPLDVPIICDTEMSEIVNASSTAQNQAEFSILDNGSILDESIHAIAVESSTPLFSDSLVNGQPSSSMDVTGYDLEEIEIPREHAKNQAGNTVTMENSESLLPDFFVEDIGERDEGEDTININEKNGTNQIEFDNPPTGDQLPTGMATPARTVTRKTRVDAPRKNSRKRESCPSRWKINAAKQALNTGKAHISVSGKERPARAMKPGCTGKCNRCGLRKLSEGERLAIFQDFWAIGIHVRQLDYILAHVKCVTPEKTFAAPGKKARENIRVYSLTVKGKNIRVCKPMFLNTLSICDSWIKTALNNSRGEHASASDNRGHHENRPHRVHSAVADSVRRHIETIPRVESHYTRSRSKREYVENGLSIEELYRRYVAWACENNIAKKASSKTYRRIFNSEFNIGFFKPKSDQCTLCLRWKKSTTSEKARIARVYAVHRENNRIAQGMKQKDKEEAATNQKLCTASFDLQKVLACPRTEAGTSFYKSKLSVYNLTVFDMYPKIGTCYVWNETQAHRGSNEIASAVYHWIKKNKGCKEFRLYSDNPTSQNKNRFMFGMYLLCSAKFGVKITHTFLEVGHTHMEVDSIHATIEKAALKQEIHDVEDWYDTITRAKKSGDSYIIEKYGEDFFTLNFKLLVEAQNWSKDTTNKVISWKKVRVVSVDPSRPNEVALKYEYLGEPVTLLVTQKKGRPVNLKTYQPPLAYQVAFPLPALKIKHLRELMKEGAIPSKNHEFYEGLFNIGVAAAEAPDRECPEDCNCCEDEGEEILAASVDDN